MPSTLAIITQSYLTDIANAIRAKLGVATTYKPSEMAAAIASIPSGGGGGNAGEISRYALDSQGNAMLRDTNLTFTGVKALGAKALYYGFYDSQVSGMSFPDLETIATYGLRSVCEPTTPYITNAKLASISFPKLQFVDVDGLSYAFRNQIILPSAAFPELTEIGQRGMSNCFYGCSALASVSFPKLATTANAALSAAFYNCGALTSISFPALVNPHAGTFSTTAFSGCNSLTEFHFRQDMQATIEALNNYSTLWGRGAGNATVYFDL